MRLILMLVLTSSGCAFYQKQWAQHGHCVTLCNKFTGRMSMAMAINPQQCLCDAPDFPPKTGEFERSDDVYGVITCDPDCKTLAEDLKKKEK